jgi:DNA-binding Xre family transcriptional regulator
MHTITSQLDKLMGLKGIQDHRRLSYRIVARETGVPIKTVIGIANNTIQLYPADALVALCGYFDCLPGDILCLTEVREEQVPPARRLAMERRQQRLEGRLRERQENGQ